MHWRGRRGRTASPSPWRDDNDDDPAARRAFSRARRAFVSLFSRCSLAVSFRFVRSFVRLFVRFALPRALRRYSPYPFVLRGYRLDYDACGCASSTVSHLHNETLNIWSHALGALAWAAAARAQLAAPPLALRSDALAYWAR